MKAISILPPAALASAIVIPDAEVMSQVAIEPQSKASTSRDPPLMKEIKSVFDDVEDTLSDLLKTTKNVFDDAMDTADEKVKTTRKNCHQKVSDAQQWVESNLAEAELKAKEFKESGKHGHHKHKPNKTIYQLISESEYTSRLTALVDEYPDLVSTLNGTAANYTLFAPINKAFEKVPEHAPKPSKEQLKDILLYHVSGEFYPAGRVLVTHTVPTLLDAEYIGGRPQRLSTNIGFKGLTVNFYSRIIAIDIVCHPSIPPLYNFIANL